MPWNTPSLREVRGFVRDNIRGSLPGADATIPNSVLRVLSDNQGGLCHLTLQYIDWLALQLIPDTAESIWLDRHGDIWLTNADGTTGRKMATLAEGTIDVTGNGGTAIPQGHHFTYSGGQVYESTELVILLADAATPVPVRALDPGAAGNLPPGTIVSMVPLAGIDTGATVVVLDGGADTENDDDLRVRVLQRIRQPPMGGAVHDYIRWTLAVPGVTRAWCAPLEMGIGTVTVRFMCDELRAEDNDGFPIQEDIDRVYDYLDTVRPVAVKDIFVVGPLKQLIDINIVDLNPDTADVRGAIQASIEEMLLNVAAPGQTIYAAWKYAAIMNTPGVISFGMTTTEDDEMPSPGHMAVLGDIYFTIEALLRAPPTAPPGQSDESGFQESAFQGSAFQTEEPKKKTLMLPKPNGSKNGG